MDRRLPDRRRLTLWSTDAYDTPSALGPSDLQFLFEFHEHSNAARTLEHLAVPSAAFAAFAAAAILRVSNFAQSP
jgi:hypothetical protein